ncbi:MAG: helix-turn-helix transcriptional regulator [Myxococcota bacterium]
MRNSLYSARYKRFLARLRGARKAAGLSQAQAARRLRRPQSFLSKVESGERRVDIVELEELARVYRVDPADFLERS